MPAPELEQIGPPEQHGVETVPETTTLPEKLEKAGVKTVPYTPAQITDEATGQVVADSHPSGRQNIITLPDDPETARVMANSPPSEAARGRGIYILRQIKKAILNGAKILWK